MTEDKQTPENRSLSLPTPQLVTNTSEAGATLTDALKHVCEETDWEYGEVWIPEADNTILQLSPVWYISTRVDSDRELAWKQFRCCSEEFVLHPGEGLPGRVFSSRQPEWLADVSSQSEFYFLRNQIAKAFGVKSAFGVPVVEGDLQLVLVFFMSKIWDEDKQMIASTEAVAEQLKPLLPSLN
ncbi:MAG: GAF domain-containing protein [Microcoleus sp. SIO2G3]|nr:GAF domain-containing protein [Microcoleus sp. SIO2G3]